MWALGKEVVEGDGGWIWGRGRLEDSDVSEIKIRDEADLDGLGWEKGKEANSAVQGPESPISTLTVRVNGAIWIQAEDVPIVTPVPKVKVLNLESQGP